jgi:hypothetical protein
VTKRKSKPIIGPVEFIDRVIRLDEKPGLRPDPNGALFIGIDASVKHDSTALACVKYDQHSDNLVLADHRVWAPSPGSPMDFEATIEFYLRRLQGYNTSIEKILVDPFQMHRTITTLQQAGLPISSPSRKLCRISPWRRKLCIARSPRSAFESTTRRICARTS